MFLGTNQPSLSFYQIFSYNVMVANNETVDEFHNLNFEQPSEVEF